MVQTSILFLIAAFAFFIKGITGFGNTLVMASLFSLVVSPKLVGPVDLILSIPTNAWLVYRNRKSIDPKIVIPLAIVMVAGAVPGAFFLKVGNDRLLRVILGLVIVGVGIEMYTRRPTTGGTAKLHPSFLLVMGLVAGLLTGLYGIGAPLVAYIGRTTGGRSSFRANLCSVFLVENIIRTGVYLSTGLLDSRTAGLAGLLFPAAALGMALGGLVDSRLNERAVRIAVIVLLLCAGVFLFLRNI